MTANELSTMLNINVDEAQDLIDRCDRFDRACYALYDEERRDQAFDDLIEAADWDFDLTDYEIDA